MNTTDRTILLTGATSGLGRAVAGTLANDKVRLILHGQRRRAIEAVASRTCAEAPAQIELVQADLSDLNQVQRLADEVVELTDQLDVLVHNAGVGKGADDTRQLSADGYEAAVCGEPSGPVCADPAPVALLEVGAPSRMVNVASGAQQPIDFADPQLEHGYSGNRAYAQSKFALVTFGFALAKTLLADVVTVNSLHPATLMPTRMVKEGYGHTVDDLQTGVDAVLNLIDNPGLEGTTGQYFSIQQPAAAHRETYETETQRRLWQLSEELTGVQY